MTIRRIVMITAFVIVGSFPLPALGEKSQEGQAKSPPRDLPIQSVFQTDSAKVEVLADSLEYSKEQNKVIGKGNVTISYEGTQLTADYAEVETNTKKAYARGHVIVFKNGMAAAHGEEVHYDFANKSGSFPGGINFTPPWFTSGQELIQPKEGVKIITNAKLTSCSLENPHYYIRAKKITIHEGDKLVARNVTFYALGKPIFWVPVFVLPLQDESLPFAISTGYTTKYGYFIHASKGFGIIRQIFGKIHTDWRSRRGFGAGGDLNYNFGPLARGSVKMYLTQDKRAPTPGTSDPNPYGELEDRARGRITYRHRTDFDPDTHIILQYNRLADEYFLQDFFEREFRAEIEPQSFATLTKNTEHFGLLAHAQKRMNRFESLVERLPHLQLDVRNQPVLRPWLFYEGQLTYSNLAKRFGRMSIQEDVNRVDNVHELSTPVKWKNIKFTPFTQYRGTFYSRERTEADQRFRTLFGWGTDVRTHFYKTYNSNLDQWGIEINQMRHVVEPFFQYRSTKPSIADERLGQFDSIDRLDDSDIFTFGLENRVQTKRAVRGKMQRVDLVSMNTYLSYELHPDGHSQAGLFAPYEDGRSRSNFTILSQEVVLRPYNWLQYEGRADYDVEFDHFRVLNQDLKVYANKLSLIFGHRFIRDLMDFSGNAIEGSNQFIFEGNYSLNPLWKLGGYIRWNAATMELDEWQIGASRDLHDFIFDFGYNVRNSSIEGNNQTLYFDFSLKAVPMIHVSGGDSRASFEAPRIGETVSGSNPPSSAVSAFS